MNVEDFEDCFSIYMEDMAGAIESEVPYHNLEEYWRWRARAA